MKKAKQTLNQQVSRHLARDYEGPWTVEYRNLRIQLYEGKKLIFDVEPTPDVVRVFQWLVVALEDREQLVTRLKERISGLEAARPKRRDIIRSIVLEAAASLPTHPTGSAAGLVTRVRKAANREIARRRKADPGRDNPQTPARDDVTERYVRQVLRNASSEQVDE